ncbi:hypothetical protein KPH14_012643 [Odynerus spinipes]|uniref:Uncharacterized protein n=1 Tax=Odynerus spinipes TaxID=1348599 RepID=A0AAD9RFM4_9HYME|nr:hypothetical protein KPH14_012643 [Odynerus spinipes]
MSPIKDHDEHLWIEIFRRQNSTPFGSPGEGQSGGAHRGEEKRAAGYWFDTSRVSHRGVHDRRWAAQGSGQSAGRSHPCPEGASPNCIPPRPWPSA